MTKVIEIKYPKKTTHFIAMDKKCNITDKKCNISYGSIMPDQVMTTGLQNVESFIDESKFLEKLKSLGVLIGT